MGTSTIAKLTILWQQPAIDARGIRQPSSPFDWLYPKLEWDFTNPKEPKEKAAKE